MEDVLWPSDTKQKQGDAGSITRSGLFRTKGSDQQPVIRDFPRVASKYSESGEKQIQKVKNQKRVLDYEIKGERFEIHLKNDLVYINHPKWSLVGMGGTLLDAEIDMLEEAKLIAEEYLEMEDSQLSYEAQKFKEYLIRII